MKNEIQDVLDDYERDIEKCLKELEHLARALYRLAQDLHRLNQRQREQREQLQSENAPKLVNGMVKDAKKKTIEFTQKIGQMNQALHSYLMQSHPDYAEHFNYFFQDSGWPTTEQMAQFMHDYLAYKGEVNVFDDFSQQYTDGMAKITKEYYDFEQDRYQFDYDRGLFYDRETGQYGDFEGGDIDNFVPVQDEKVVPHDAFTIQSLIQDLQDLEDFDWTMEELTDEKDISLENTDREQ